jgi:uncharacterized protein (DUF58 family)
VRRGSSVAGALGIIALVAAWAFGSNPAMVIGLGLLLSAAYARLWARGARESLDVERRLLPGERVEGGDVRIVVGAQKRRRALGGTTTVRQRLGATEVVRRTRSPRVELVFAGLPRGSHDLGPLEVALTDPLALERVTQILDDGLVVLVRPRIPVLGPLFSTHGAREAGAARATVRRASGFEIHAIREYAPGEPLRAVHWPSTARRQQLMVKELDDAPRDEVAVVLDQDPDGVAGPTGSSSFDASVRATGALARAHALHNKRAVIVGSSASFVPVALHSIGHDWELALDALAAVTPVPGARIAAALRSPAGPIRHAREVVVVTGRPDLAVEPMLDLRDSGRRVSLVVVASETFAGRARRDADPAALLAAAHGIPVAVISAGTPLEDALTGSVARALGA